MASIPLVANPTLAQVSPLPNKKSFCTKISELKLSPKQKLLIQTVGQIAVRILFALSVILIATAVFPLSIQAVAIPLAAIGSSFLAAFFFPASSKSLIHPLSLPPLLLPQAEPRIRLAEPQAPVISPNAPRGIFRQGMNCCFNSLYQLIQSEPGLAQWFRTPVPQDLEGFINFLAPYHPPLAWMNLFRQYFINKNPPLFPSVAFVHFLEANRPEFNNRATLLKFQGIAQHLVILQPTFQHFSAAYEQAAAQGQPLVGVNSQMLRLAVNLVAPRGMISESSGRQEDPMEALNAILQHLPDQMNARYDMVSTYDMRGLPAMAELPDGVSRKEETSGYFTLEIGAEPDLGKMFAHHFDHNPGNLHGTMGVDGARHSYPAIRKQYEFREAPQVLRFQVKRFRAVPPPQSLLTRILPSWFPGMQWRPEKIGIPIVVPREITLPLMNGAVQKYRLSGCVNHHGNSATSGHYTSGRIVNNEFYLMDDAVVTQVDGQTFDRFAQESYLQTYVLARD
ncbi:MAG: ubiquitin carboxyl-terminal hydrolase family protein [Chlamydiota bacterium]